MVLCAIIKKPCSGDGGNMTKPQFILAPTQETPHTHSKNVSRASGLVWNKMCGRGRAGIEPATSRTRSENHTTRPTAHAQGKQLRWLVPLCTVCICSERILRLGTKPPWPNGQGAPLLRVRLWVRVPLGVFEFFFSLVSITKKRYPVWDSNPQPSD